AEHRPDKPGLYCIELRTSKWQASLDWYRNVLGLQVLVRVVDEGYALLEAGETRLALLAREAPEASTTRISFAFEVVDLAAVLVRLEQAGTKFSIPEVQSEHLREVNLTDPDG